MVYDLYLEVQLEREIIHRERVPFECTFGKFVRILDACANSFLPFAFKLEIKLLVQVLNSDHI